MQNATHDNFVGIYDGFYTSDYCKAMIEYFEEADKFGKTWQRDYTTEVFKSDTSTSLLSPEHISFSKDNLGHYHDVLTQTFWENIYPLYIKEYSVIKQMPTQMIYTIKVQRTRPTEGYHVWHSEGGGRDLNARLGVWALYLNTIREGGETEFLYSGQRIKPVEGRMLVWPAGYTHTHRGNPPLGNQTKYIMTGWIEFVN